MFELHPMSDSDWGKHFWKWNAIQGECKGGRFAPKMANFLICKWSQACPEQWRTGSFRPACIRLLSRLACASYFNQLPTFYLCCLGKFGFHIPGRRGNNADRAIKSRTDATGIHIPTMHSCTLAIPPMHTACTVAQLHSCKQKGELQNTLHTWQRLQ